MKINTAKAKELDAFLATAQRVPDEKLKLFYKGERHEHMIYRVPIDLLLFNIGNGRFAAPHSTSKCNTLTKGFRRSFKSQALPG